jgi:hypothetical protein
MLSSLNFGVAIAANESPHPLHSASFFCDVSPKYLSTIGQTQVEHNRSKPKYNRRHPFLRPWCILWGVHVYHAWSLLALWKGEVGASVLAASLLLFVARMTYISSAPGYSLLCFSHLLRPNFKRKYKIRGSTEKNKNSQRFVYRPRSIHTCQKRTLKISWDTPFKVHAPSRESGNVSIIRNSECFFYIYIPCIPITYCTELPKNSRNYAEFCVTEFDGIPRNLVT